MASKKQKYYVIWEGHEIGIVDSWQECKRLITNYSNAKYKSFTSLKEAETALNQGYFQYKKEEKSKEKVSLQAFANEIDFNSICVDAASSGNPGRMEYRGVDTQSKNQLFHQGPFPEGTSNIGEFLALVHGLALLKKNNSKRLIYSDSKIAMGWIKKKKCNTKLQPNPKNKALFELIQRAEHWLKTNSFTTEIRKWETKKWGEIPADFGRK